MTDTDPNDECIHLIYPATSCSICFPYRPSKKEKFDKLIPKPTFQRLGGTPVIAEFDGWCGQCGGRIEKDLDEIVMYRGEWVHADCAHGEG